MARRSANKGKTGELEAVGLLTVELALPPGQLRRGRQEWGAHQEPDVVGVDGWWVEVKRQQRPCFGAWLVLLLQHLTRARSKANPLLLWRRDRSPIWWAVVRLTDWAALVRERAHLAEENARLRSALALPPRPITVEPGARQVTISEALP